MFIYSFLGLVEGADLAELMAEQIALKPWGTLTETWVPHDVRDQVVDFVRRWSEKAEISVGRFIHWLGGTVSKFYAAALWTSE